MSIQLWTEKYRPKTLDEYVWRDPTMRAKVQRWVGDGAVPHLLLAGSAGTGKTSLALLLIRLLDIPAGDVLIINASRERKIEDIQDRIANFVGTWALGPSGIKYVILDEFDAVSPQAQKMLRADMETYAHITRFIATCNYPQKIIPALHSRFTLLEFQTLATDDFMVRVGEILAKEGIEFDYDALETFVRASHPDLRKCIGMVQDNALDGRLVLPRASEGGTRDYLLSMVEMFKNGQINAARKLIIEQAQPEEYPDIYRFLYRNTELFASTDDGRDECLIIIKNAVVNAALAFDPEILLSATLAELSRVAAHETA